MQNDNNINENELNELLRKLYLEEKGKQVDDTEAEFILNQEYDVKIDPKKEQELLNKLSTKKGGGSNYKQYFISAFAVLGIVSVLIYFVNYFDKQNKKTVAKTENDIAKLEEENGNYSSTNVDVIENRKRIFYIKNDSQIQSSDSTQTTVLKSDSIYKQAQTLTTAKPYIKEQSNKFQVPVLSNKEINRFQNIKNLILAKFVEQNKSLYTKVQGTQISYRGKMIVVNPFTIRNFEITNLEYKTFLIDLIYQGRKADYQIAQVHTELWNNYNINSFANNYFQKEDYNDFPVVNISAEGAKLFCQWLEEEVIQYCKNNNLKVKPLKVRLPSDSEWIAAADMGYAKVPSGSGYNTIFNFKEGLVNQTFVKRIELINKRRHNKFKDSLDYWYAVNHYGMNETELTNTLNNGFNLYNKFPTDTIHSIRIKTFCNIGHVSEMIYETGTKEVKIMGACWDSKETFSKMQNEFTKAWASPYIGFRLVIIDENAPEYKNPFW